MTPQKEIEAQLKDILVKSEGSEILNHAKWAIEKLFSLSLDNHPLMPLEFAYIIWGILCVTHHQQVDDETIAKLDPDVSALPLLELIAAIASQGIKTCPDAIAWLKNNCNNPN